MEEYPSFKNLIEGKVYTVSDITERVKRTIEENIGFEFVWVLGEISNFRGNYASGHWYFSLTDENSQLSAVCFKWANQYIKFVPEDGMEVICCGLIGVYEKAGIYQINVRYIEPKGVGAQAIALEQLKEKLLTEGLFDEDRKQPLPFLPQRIGIVTSATGAALRDILQVLHRRFPNLETVISPTRVQGNQAPREIASALDKLYRITDLDLIILARGGGSKEDLWAFNEEMVAREIAKSPVPLISAVGHETDVSISDLVADVRAATPSMAAEIAVREKKELVLALHELKLRAVSSLRKEVEQGEKEIDRIRTNLLNTMRVKLDSWHSQMKAISGKLDALSPLKVLDRGYSITHSLPSMRVVKSSNALDSGDEVLIRFQTGRARCRVEKTED